MGLKKYLLIIYPLSNNITEYENVFNNILKDSIWINGKAIITTKNEWKFLITKKEKEEHILTFFCSDCSYNIYDIITYDIDVDPNNNCFNGESIIKFPENIKFKGSLIIYPQTTEIPTLDTIIDDSIWRYGIDIIPDKKDWNFLIIHKDKEKNIMQLFNVQCKPDLNHIFKCEINIKSVDNDVRNQAMSDYFEKYQYGQNILLKDTVIKVNESYLEEAKTDSHIYDLIQTSYKKNLNEEFNKIRNNDITDDKTFSEECSKKYLSAINNFNCKRPIRRR